MFSSAALTPQRHALPCQCPTLTPQTPETRLFSIQASSFAMLDKNQLSIWEALDLLHDLREYEAVLVRT